MEVSHSAFCSQGGLIQEVHIESLIWRISIKPLFCRYDTSVACCCVVLTYCAAVAAAEVSQVEVSYQKCTVTMQPYGPRERRDLQGKDRSRVCLLFVSCELF